jgi:hypothetical protein
MPIEREPYFTTEWVKQCEAVMAHAGVGAILPHPPVDDAMWHNLKYMAKTGGYGMGPEEIQATAKWAESEIRKLKAET